MIRAVRFQGGADARARQKRKARGKVRREEAGRLPLFYVVAKATTHKEWLRFFQAAATRR
jgi:hypothetical protein